MLGEGRASRSLGSRSLHKAGTEKKPTAVSSTEENERAQELPTHGLSVVRQLVGSASLYAPAKPRRDTKQEPVSLAGPHSVSFLWPLPLLSLCFQTMESKRDRIALKRPSLPNAVFPVYCTRCGTLRRHCRVMKFKLK